MRYFTIPASEMIVDSEGHKKDYGWKELHEEVVLTHEEWRSGSADVLKAYDEVEQKCTGVVGGDAVGLTDETYEIYVPILTLRGQKISMRIARAFNRLVRPVLEASHKPPKSDGAKAEYGDDGQKALAGSKARTLPAAEA